MQSLKKQAGSMLISALFIAILMLALGLALVNILSSSAHNNAVEYYGARAFMAAQSSIEKNLRPLLDNGCGSVDAAGNFNSVNYLQNCSYTMECSSIPNITDSSLPAPITVYRLSSSATCSVSNCAEGDACRKDFWQTQRSISVEAKTLN